MLRKCSRKLVTAVLMFSMVISSVVGLNVTPSITTAAAKTKLLTKKISVDAGKKKTIKLKNKSSKNKYTYVSANKKIAKVSSKGKVTGVNAGTTKITVREIQKKTKKSRKLGQVKVTVNKKNANETKNNQKVTSSAVPTYTVTASITPDTTIKGTTAPLVSGNPTAVPASAAPTVNVEINFADGNISQFSAEGDGVKIALDTAGYDDGACLKATGRSQRNDWTGCGMALDVSKYLTAGRTYSITCQVKCVKEGSMTVRSINNAGGGGFNWPSQVGESIDVKAGEWTKFSTVYASPDSIKGKVILYWDVSNTADMYIDNIVIKDVQVLDNTFKSLFTDVFGKIGTCNTYSQMKNNKSFTTALYNSVTMENETKPQSMLGGMQTSKTLPEGYVLPDNYKDSSYLVLDFKTIDQVIETAYEYGLSIRFHVLVWHSQTPSAFFKKSFDDKNGYVTKEVMDARLEYYVKNVIKHIYETPHGKDVVYCWDVANEYFHNYDSGNKSMWNTIYYPAETSAENRTNKPEYIKKAFQFAYDELKTFNLDGTVKLFYNDYNTYEVSDDIITMINYINEDGKICDGVGMQSHLSVDYPQPGMTGKIAQTIDAFAAQGYEIQITELDVTDYKNTGKQTDYYTELMNMLVAKKKAGANITGLTFWGLCDTNSWRRDGKPLLFSAIFVPKDVYYKVIETVTKAWKK